MTDQGSDRINLHVSRKGLRRDNKRFHSSKSTALVQEDALLWAALEEHDESNTQQTSRAQDIDRDLGRPRELGPWWLLGL